LYVVGEDSPLVEAAIVVSVFEDEDPIAQVQIESLGSFSVSVVLRDPETAT
jgi:hypothetical protein